MVTQEKLKTVFRQHNQSGMDALPSLYPLRYVAVKIKMAASAVSDDCRVTPNRAIISALTFI